MKDQILTLEGAPTYAAFKDREGEPISVLRIEFEKDESSRLVALLLSMQRAYDTHASAYRLVEVDRNVPIALEALVETIKVNMGASSLETPPDFMADIEAFHQKFGQEYLGKPRSLKSEGEGEDTIYDFRSKFMQEEKDEYDDEQIKLDHNIDRQDDGGIAKHLELQLDALVDLVYVVLGTAYLQFGARIYNEAWRRVHHANMQKIRADKADSGATDSGRKKTFDIVKPKDWVAPNHLDLVQDHAHVLFRMPGQLNASSDSDTSIVPTKSSVTE